LKWRSSFFQRKGDLLSTGASITSKNKQKSITTKRRAAGVKEITSTPRFQIPNFPCQHGAIFTDLTFPQLPSSAVNVAACRSPRHTPFDPAGRRAFKNEEPQDPETRNLFLISEHKSAVLELTDEMLVQRTRSELRITNA
jgi:hypothetical protein